VRVDVHAATAARTTDIPVINGESLEQAIGRASLAGLQEWYAEAERVVEAHLGGHTTLEWVTEVARLNGIIAGAMVTGEMIEVSRSDLAELLTTAPHEGGAWERLADRMLSTRRSAGEPAPLREKG